MLFGLRVVADATSWGPGWYTAANANGQQSDILIFSECQLSIVLVLLCLGNIPVVGAELGERVLPLASFVALHGSCMV